MTGLELFVYPLAVALLFALLGFWAVRRRVEVTGSLFIWKRISAGKQQVYRRPLLFPLLCAWIAGTTIFAIVAQQQREDEPASTMQLPVEKSAAPEVVAFWQDDSQAYIALYNPFDVSCSNMLEATLYSGENITLGKYPLGPVQGRVVGLTQLAETLQQIESVKYGDSRYYVRSATFGCSVDTKKYPLLSLALQSAAGVDVVDAPGEATGNIIPFTYKPAGTAAPEVRLIYAAEARVYGIRRTGRTFTGIIQPTYKFIGWNLYTQPAKLEGVEEYALPADAVTLVHLVTNEGGKVPLVSYWWSQTVSGNRMLIFFMAHRSRKWTHSIFFPASLQYLFGTVVWENRRLGKTPDNLQGVDSKVFVWKLFGVVSAIAAVAGLCILIICQMIRQKIKSS